MENKRNSELPFDKISGTHLMKISGGTTIPLWLLIKIVEWGEKFDNYIDDHVKVEL